MEGKQKFRFSKKAKCIVALVMCVVLVGGVGLVWMNNRDKKNEEIAIDDLLTPGGTVTTIELVDSANDMFIIPDKYNCGAKGELTMAYPGDTINGIKFRASGSASIITLDFVYSNKDFSGEVVFNNLDFSAYTMQMGHEMDVDRDIHVIFNNCSFDQIKNSPTSSRVYYTFNNCTMHLVQGSNYTFNRCLFGDSYWDCINPNQNVHATECYFYNVGAKDEAANGRHSDGVQIYGKAGVPVENISFTRCRFEIPAVTPSRSTGRVNSCFSIGLEYSSANGVSFDNCIVNGGGYTIYATSKSPEFTHTNVSISNIAVGGAHLFGTLYPKVADGVAFSNVYDQNSLYVSSVWSDGEKTHFITSNDTCEERTLMIYADGQTYTFDIPACIGGNDLRYGYVDYPFESFPFDIDITIPGNFVYAACFDNTNGECKQIRNINYSGETQYYLLENEDEEDLSFDFFDFSFEENGSSEAAGSAEGSESESSQNEEDTTREALVGSTFTSGPETSEMPVIPGAVDNSSASVVISGGCGSDAYYCLYSNGNLVISGFGAISNYNSASPSPWNDYSNMITSVTIEEGITSIGSQSFRKMTNVSSVSFPSSIVTIGPNSFIGCSSLKQIIMHAGVVEIAKYAFGTTAVSDIVFYGTQSDWESITIGIYNDRLFSAEKFYMTAVEPVVEAPVRTMVASGECGKSATYELYEDGELVINGTGDITNYNSIVSAPWYQYADMITSVQIAEGITRIGSQSFRKLTHVEVVIVPSTVTSIEANAFIGCSSLSTLTLPEGIKSIGRYAFNGTKLTTVIYGGNSDQWNEVSIGMFNGNLQNCVLFSK